MRPLPSSKGCIVGHSGHAVVDSEQHSRRHRTAQADLLSARTGDDRALNFQEQLQRKRRLLLQALLHDLERRIVVPHLFLRLEKVAMDVFKSLLGLLLCERVSFDLGGGVGGLLPGVLAHAAGQPRRHAIALECGLALLDSENAVEHGRRERDRYHGHLPNSEIPISLLFHYFGRFASIIPKRRNAFGLPIPQISSRRSEQVELRSQPNAPR